jgi:hypothetical protein
MSGTYDVWTDPELAYLARKDLALLAVADALVDAGQSRPYGVQKTKLRVGLLAAAVVLAAVLAGTAVGLGARLWGLVDGKPVAPRSLGSGDWTTLSMFNSFSHGLTPKEAANQARVVKSLGGVGLVAVTKVAERNGESFYMLKRTDGSRCFATGPTGGFKARPTDTGLSLLSGIGCRPGYPFPSRRAPIFDMTAYHATSFSRVTGVSGSYVWRLRGFAADPVSKVGVVATDGVLRDVTAVENNVYDAVNLPRFSPRQIVAFDKNGKRVYVQCVQEKGGCK